MPTTAVIIGGSRSSRADTDLQYIKRDGNTSVEAAVQITFEDTDANIKIQNGKIYLKTDVDSVWSQLKIYKDATTGVRHLVLEDEA